LPTAQVPVGITTVEFEATPFNSPQTSTRLLGSEGSAGAVEASGTVTAGTVVLVVEVVVLVVLLVVVVLVVLVVVTIVLATVFRAVGTPIDRGAFAGRHADARTANESASPTTTPTPAAPSRRAVPRRFRPVRSV